MTFSTEAWTAETVVPTAPGAQGVPPGLLGKPQGDWAKADNALRGLAAELAAHRARGEPGEFRPSNSTLQFSRGRVVVDIVAQGDPAALMAELRTLGLRSASQYGQVISGTLPVGALARAVEIPALQAISAAHRPVTNTGSVDGKGDDAMFADAIRASGGLTGSGIRIGMLSDSFNQKNGAATGQGSGDLPSDIIVLDDSANCGSACSDEGRAMMELAYDVAPGASFAFHTAFGGMADFANGIEELAHPGQGKSDIVVDDVIYFAEPMFQDGIIARAVDNVVAQGVPYFSSAGNYARRSYESAFVDSGELHYVSSLFGTEYRGRLHDFNPDAGASDWHQDLTVPDYTSHRIITIVLQWDQPFGSLSSGTGADVDLDIYLTDTASPANLISSSVDNNSLSNGGNGEPIEILQFQVGACDSNLQVFNGIGCLPDPGNFRILVSLYDAGNPNSGGPDYSAEMPGKFKYVMFDHNISWQYPTNSSTTFGHANAVGALATGAAYWEATPRFCNNSDGATYNDCDTADAAPTAKLEWFSSAGGTPILFDASGNRLGTPDLRRKPEVTGPDGTNTTFFFSDSTNDSDTLPNFFGTSASAPHVAGVAALMLEANSGLLPADIYDALESTAVNMNPRSTGTAEELDGFDFDTGYGFVDANAAVAAASGVTGNDAPVVTIASPTDGATVNAGDTVSFAGSATDTEDDNATLTGQLDWTSSIDGPIGTDTSSFSRSDLSAGTHTITASVTDSGGRTGQASVTLTVIDTNNEPPVASFTIKQNPCPLADPSIGGWACEFDNTSTDDDGVPTASWEWDFGDQTYNSVDWDLLFPKQVIYKIEGIYTVTLTVTDADGASSSASHQVTIGDPPDEPANTAPTVTITAPSDASAFPAGRSISFAGAASDSEDDDATLTGNLSWTSNGEPIGTGGSFSTSGLSVGSHTITASVTDSGGLSDTDSIGVTVNPVVRIGDLDNVSSSNGGRWNARVKALAVDHAGNPVAGATIFGSWSNGATGSDNCPTDDSGWCTLELPNLKNNVSTVTLTISNVGASGRTYDSGQNSDPDGDSDGTAITVSPNGDSSTTNTAPSVTMSSPADGATFSSGQIISFSGSATDTEDGDLTGSLAWSSNLVGSIGSGGSFTRTLIDGTHTITATVTDNGGAESTASVSITVGEGSSATDFTLTANGYKVQGKHTVDLDWNSSNTDVTDGDITIHRNGSLIGTLPYANGGDGSHTDAMENKGGGTYRYKVCDAETPSVCSNEATVTF